jgi:hypothetical protein
MRDPPWQVDKDEAERENNEYSNHEKSMMKHFPALLLEGSSR